MEGGEHLKHGRRRWRDFRPFLMIWSAEMVTEYWTLQELFEGERCRINCDI